MTSRHDSNEAVSPARGHRRRRLYAVIPAVVVLGAVPYFYAGSRTPSDSPHGGSGVAHHATARTSAKLTYGVLSEDETSVRFYETKEDWEKVLALEKNASLLAKSASSGEKAKCDADPEYCATLVFLKRYEETTSAYLGKLDRAQPLDALLDIVARGAERGPQPPVANVPDRERRRAIPIDSLKRIPDASSLLSDHLPKAAYQGTDAWSLSGVPFHQQQWLITPRLRCLTLHRSTGEPETVSRRDSLVFEKYAGGMRLYSVNVLDRLGSADGNPDTAIVMHPYRPSIAVDPRDGKALSYGFSGYGLLQDGQPELIEISSASPLFGEFKIPEDRSLDLNNPSGKPIREYFTDFCQRARRLNEAMYKANKVAIVTGH